MKFSETFKKIEHIKKDDTFVIVTQIDGTIALRLQYKLSSMFRHIIQDNPFKNWNWKLPSDVWSEDIAWWEVTDLNPFFSDPQNHQPELRPGSPRGSSN